MMFSFIYLVIDLNTCRMTWQKLFKVRGQDVTVKTVSMKDNTGTIKVSLWRDLAEPSFIGKFLQMTNVIVTAFNDEISISSTSKTDLKVNYLK